MLRSHMTGRAPGPAGPDGGQAYVEFAFVLPVLLVMAMTATDLVRVASARGTAESTAATIAVRSSMLVSKGDDSLAGEVGDIVTQALSEASPGAGVTLSCPASAFDTTASGTTLSSAGYAVHAPASTTSYAYHTVYEDIEAPYRDATVAVSVTADLDLESPVVAVVSLVSGGAVPTHAHIVSSQYVAHPDVTTPFDWGDQP